jgi:AAA ATPase domain
MEVLGRGTELAQIEDWLGGGARAWPAGGGGSAVLALEGERGIGKTTLWLRAGERARERGWRMLSCRPSPSDAGLLGTVPGEAYEELPGPQRRSLRVAPLREDAGAGDLDPRTVATALTALLAELSATEPLMLAVDDAQWLDPASARSLAFALRRLDDRPVRLLAAVRIGDGPVRRPGAFTTVVAALDRPAIRRLTVGPLTVAATHQLLRQALGTSFPRPVLVRVHRAAAGNPFYALEIARETARLGVPPPSQPLPVPGDHRELALLRLRRGAAANRGSRPPSGRSASWPPPGSATGR